MQIGDVVRLKDLQGPRMVVESAASDYTWFCVWWVESKGDFNGRAFSEQMLELARL